MATDPGADIVFTQEDIDLLLKNVHNLSSEELDELEEIVTDLVNRQRLQTLRSDLIAFCCHMQADYKVGSHHRRLAQLLEDIEASRKDRICVSIPPRHGKSQLVSIYYAAWYIGRNPTHKIMLVSHTTDLAVDFGRKIRNLIATEAYREVFPDVRLASDSKSAGRWNTNQGGEFFAAGVGSALAGRGAHLLLVDDPHSEQDVLNGNYEVFSKAYEWFTFGARTRLMPGGRVAIVHCMTGDTGVLRPDGTETPLRDIRAGDMIASYDRGRLVSKTVLNWANQGPDYVYSIRLNNDNLIRANARHPFLVVRDGVETWVKVRDLRVGDSLVSLKGVDGSPNQTAPQAGARSAKTASNGTARLPVGALKITHQRFASQTAAKTSRGHALRLENALRAYPEIHTIERTLTPCIASPVIGANIAGSSVLKRAVMHLRALAACAPNTITNKITRYAKLRECTSTQKSGSTTTLLPAMASRTMSTCSFARSRRIGALSALSTPVMWLGRLLGALNTRLPSTTVTAAVKFEPSCATRATCLYPAAGQSQCSSGQFSTSEIISITPDGVEDVFDIQVEDTENFIANGVVSHNTRWHQADLIGRVIADMAKNEGADQYEVFEFPAILTSTDPETGEVVEKALWPEFFDLPALRRTKASMPVFQWNAQYQQQPTSEEAAIVKREWWRIWTREQPPACDYIIASLDAAAETHNRADFTALTLWGIFLNEEEDHHQLILLHSIKERLEFPELKKLTLDIYRDWEPDSFIVEKKSAGVALYQELRRMGLPITEYTPHRGTGDKLARLNSVTDIISSGMVWVPERRWAEELVEEIAAFPFGQHDDLVDSTVQALMRFRQGGFIRLPSDELEEVDTRLPVHEGYY